jgi:transposase InsO family protein
VELLVSQAYSNYYLLIDATGIPLAVGRSAANTHDSLLLKQLVDAVPAIIRRRGRPVDPAELHADNGDDDPSRRRLLRRSNITPRIARRGCWPIDAARSATNAASAS